VKAAFLVLFAQLLRLCSLISKSDTVGKPSWKSLLELVPCVRAARDKRENWVSQQCQSAEEPTIDEHLNALNEMLRHLQAISEEQKALLTQILARLPENPRDNE
jgi:hypothetical protein